MSKLKHEIKKCCNENEDSIMIYRFDSLRYSNKGVIGLHMANDNII